MSDEIPADRPANDPPANRASERGLGGRVRGRRSWRRTARWLGELTTIFVGVYAAFLLSNYSGHRLARQKRNQILTWVEENYTGALENAQEQVPRLRELRDDFNRQLAAGEMPEIKTISWVGDYDPSDSIGVLQSGGYELLDIETIRDIREVESTLRVLVTRILRAQQLSDTMILPNRGKDPAIFYDLATHRLRDAYAWYPQAFDEETAHNEELLPKITKLLARVHAERQRED